MFWGGDIRDDTDETAEVRRIRVPARIGDCVDCDGDVNGTIVPAPALTVANMTVVGTHIVTDFDDHSDRVVDQYVYLGLVDDRHIVAVSATAGPAASDLPKIDVAFVQHIFQKAVEAVRS